MNPRIFREYDIRGNADQDLDDDLVENLGRALGAQFFAENGECTIALGRDCRLTSPRIRDALLKGLCTAPIVVIDIGIVSTPLLYFAPFHLDLAGGVMITGSHNPAPDNGFKMVFGRSTIHGKAIQSLKTRIETSDFLSASGTHKEQDIVPAYLDLVCEKVQLGKRRFKIVVDAGNGPGGIVAVPLYRRLGFDVVPLYCEPDGRFPNHHPDPTVEDNLADLKATVAKENAELGIAFDGDADRIGVVDSRGRVVWGDQLMLLFARAILQEHPGATFVSEVKCSQVLFDEIESLGGKAIMWKVGHSLIKSKMKETDALLAGEMSGHMFFAHRYFGYDDAIYAGARLLELCSRTEQTFDQLVDTLPKVVNTPEIRMEMPDDVKFDVVAKFTAKMQENYSVVDIDGARVSFADGWGLVRASNTQAALVLRFESSTEDALAQNRKLVEDALREIRDAT